MRRQCATSLALLSLVCSPIYMGCAKNVPPAPEDPKSRITDIATRSPDWYSGGIDFFLRGLEALNSLATKIPFLGDSLELVEIHDAERFAAAQEAVVAWRNVKIDESIEAILANNEKLFEHKENRNSELAMTGAAVRIPELILVRPLKVTDGRVSPEAKSIAELLNLFDLATRHEALAIEQLAVARMIKKEVDAIELLARKNFERIDGWIAAQSQARATLQNDIKKLQSPNLQASEAIRASLNIIGALEVVTEVPAPQRISGSDAILQSARGLRLITPESIRGETGSVPARALRAEAGARMARDNEELAIAFVLSLDDTTAIAPMGLNPQQRVAQKLDAADIGLRQLEHNLMDARPDGDDADKVWRLPLWYLLSQEYLAVANALGATPVTAAENARLLALTAWDNAQSAQNAVNETIRYLEEQKGIASFIRAQAAAVLDDKDGRSLFGTAAVETRELGARLSIGRTLSQNLAGQRQAMLQAGTPEASSTLLQLLNDGLNDARPDGVKVTTTITNGEAGTGTGMTATTKTKHGFVVNPDQIAMFHLQLYTAALWIRVEAANTWLQSWYGDRIAFTNETHLLRMSRIELLNKRNMVARGLDYQEVMHARGIRPEHVVGIAVAAGLADD